MKPLLKLALALLAVLAVSACSLPRGAAILNEVVHTKKSETATFQVVDVTRANLPTLAKWPRTGGPTHFHWLKGTKGPSGNVIRSGDLVDLIIWDNDENSLLLAPGQKSVAMRGIVVSPGGTIFVPYLGNIKVSGRSPASARTVIENRLADVSPAVQVQLTSTAGQGNSVDLVAGVARPGTYPMPGRDFSILSLIAQGGGISESLRNPVVRLIRGGHTYNIHAEELFAHQSRNVVLRGGDKVLVREDDRFFTALGATGSEKIVYFDRDQITAMEALSMLGGLNDSTANLKAVLVLREFPAKRVSPLPTTPDMQDVVFVMDLRHADGLFAARNFRINPGDTILATESAVNSVRTVFALIGSAIGVSNSLSD